MSVASAADFPERGFGYDDLDTRDAIRDYLRQALELEANGHLPVETANGELIWFSPIEDDDGL